MSTGITQAAQQFNQASEEMRRLREEYEQLKQAMERGTGSGSVPQQMRDLRTMYAEARQEAERANEIFMRTGGAFQALGHAPPSKELRNYIKSLGEEATRAGEQIQRKVIEPITKGGGASASDGKKGGGGRFGGGGLYGLMFMLDDLQYVGTMGIRPIVNNLMMIHPVLGMIGLAADQAVRHWSYLERMWTGETAAKTQAEQMKELAKATALTVEEARRLSQYTMEQGEGKQLVTQLTGEQTEQKGLVKSIYKGQDIGTMVQAITEARIGESEGLTYTPEQQKELDRLIEVQKANEGQPNTLGKFLSYSQAQVTKSAIMGGYFKAPTGNESSPLGMVVDIPRYIQDRIQEIQHEARRAMEAGVAGEFAGAETDPAKLRKLVEEFNKLGAGGTAVGAGLSAVAGGTMMTPEEVSVGIGEFMHQQQRYAQTSEDSTQKITRLRESAEEYKDKIDQITDSMNKGIIDQETGVQVQLRLATAMRTANEQADDLVTAHDRLVKKMNEEDMAVLAEQQAKEKSAQQEKSFDVAAKAYAGTMGGSLAQAMMVARARGEDPEAVDIRLRGQLERRMQAIPEGIRGEVSRRVIDQVREQALGMVAQQGAVRDAQRAAAQAQFAPAGTALGIAQRQMWAQQEALSGVTPEGQMRLMGPNTVIGAMQRQALAAQKPAMQDQAVANDLAKRMEAAATNIQEATARMARGDIKVKF